jgi:hypothetical protein
MNHPDEKNHNLFKFYGAKSKEYRQKCIGLLPSIFKSGIYKQKGFESIFEYAAKLAGMSHEMVKRVLSLDESFEEKPSLRNLLVSGTVSVHKLARVASVATAKNQEFWATQVQVLPKSALETLLKDEKTNTINLQFQQENSKTENGLQETLFYQYFVPGHKIEIENDQGNTQLQAHQNIAGNQSFSRQCQQLQLSPEVGQKLLELQNKGIDINKLILEFLEKRDLEIAQEKERIAAEIREKNQNGDDGVHNPENQTQATTSLNPNAQSPAPNHRYIPAKIKKILQKEHGTKCSITTCNKPSKEIHHTQRFALGKNHDPHYLAPLCAQHHQIAHSIDLKKFTIQQKLGYK